MSNIYLKVTVEKNWRSQNFSFLGLKNFASHQVSLWGAPAHANIIEFWKFLLQLKSHKFGSETMCDYSIILILKGIMTF